MLGNVVKGVHMWACLWDEHFPSLVLPYSTDKIQIQIIDLPLDLILPLETFISKFASRVSLCDAHLGHYRDAKSHQSTASLYSAKYTSSQVCILHRWRRGRMVPISKFASRVSLCDAHHRQYRDAKSHQSTTSLYSAKYTSSQVCILHRWGGGGWSRLASLQPGLAYVMHTSGTTGMPKVIRVLHHCILPNILHLRYVLFYTGGEGKDGPD